MRKFGQVVTFPNAHLHFLHALQIRNLHQSYFNECGSAIICGKPDRCLLNVDWAVQAKVKKLKPGLDQSLPWISDVGIFVNEGLRSRKVGAVVVNVSSQNKSPTSHLSRSSLWKGFQLWDLKHAGMTWRSVRNETAGWSQTQVPWWAGGRVFRFFKAWDLSLKSDGFCCEMSTNALPTISPVVKDNRETYEVR